MRLAGQGARNERGYAMAALLVGLSVMAVLMSALLPAWTQLSTREKEEELIFRGNQYARAIGLFQRKFANTPPPSIDVLVEQRFLRKKYKDPIANDDFQPIYANQAATTVTAPQAAARPGQSASAVQPAPSPVAVAGGIAPNGAAGGIIGVTSKSTDASIKLYNGRDHYNQWLFVYVQTAVQPGGTGGVPGARGPGGPGGRGGPGNQGFQGPGGRSQFQPFPGGQQQGQPSRPPVGGTSPFGFPQQQQQAPPTQGRRPPR